MEFHEWEWFTGEVPKGPVQVQCVSQSRTEAVAERPGCASRFRWSIKGLSGDIIAFRRVKEPVRGDVEILWHKAHGSPTHSLTVPTEDGVLICGEYVGPGGAVVKVEVL